MASARFALRTNQDASVRTRARLIEAAESLFAERGYRATSVRDITAHARCNLASVTYHFGGKTSLYREVLRRRMKALREQRISSIRLALQAAEHPDLEILLRAFTRAFLEPHLDESKGRVLMQLFSRELLDPHLARNTLQKEMVAPVQESLIGAMRALGLGLTGREARRCVQSIVAQLAHAVRMRAMPGTASARMRQDFALDEIADHIVRFSMAGIGSYEDKR